MQELLSQCQFCCGTNIGCTMRMVGGGIGNSSANIGVLLGFFHAARVSANAPFLRLKPLSFLQLSIFNRGSVVSLFLCIVRAHNCANFKLAVSIFSVTVFLSDHQYRSLQSNLNLRCSIVQPLLPIMHALFPLSFSHLTTKHDQQAKLNNDANENT